MTDPISRTDLPDDLMSREWWTTTVEDHLTGIYRFIRYRVPSEAVEDLVQDVFVSAASTLSSFNPNHGTPWQWLLGIARNKIALHHRKSRSHRPLHQGLEWAAEHDGHLRRALLAESPLPQEVCEREEFHALARAALSTLEPQHRECLLAKYFDDLSLAQLSQRFNLSRSAVNSLLYRARRELRAAFFSLIGEATHTEEYGQ